MNTKKIILSILAVFAIAANALAWDYKFELYDEQGQPMPEGTKIGFSLVATSPDDAEIYYSVAQTAKTLNNFLIIEDGVAGKACQVSEPVFNDGLYGTWAAMLAEVGEAFNLVIKIDPKGGTNYTIEGKKTAKPALEVASFGDMPLSNVKVVVENTTNCTFTYSLLGRTSAEPESEVMRVPAYSPIYFSGNFTSGNPAADVAAVNIFLNDKRVNIELSYLSKDKLTVDASEITETAKEGPGFSNLTYTDLDPNAQAGIGFTLRWDFAPLPGVAYDYKSFDNFPIGPFPLLDNVNVIKIQVVKKDVIN